jgi:protein SCO1/2
MKTGLTLLILLVLAAGALQAQTAQSGIPGPLQHVSIEQRLNQQVPLDLMFKNENGRSVRLGDYFGEKPVILSLAYYHCPMLCPYVLQGLSGALKAVSFSAGKDFTVLTISFDPTDTPEDAAQQKQKYIKAYGRMGAENGWHFLTGTQQAIDRITKSVGFYYEYDSSNKQFAHASAVYVLTPEGKLSRYFFGIEYPPKDIKLALVESSEGKIGSPVDKLLLFCFHYDPKTGKYSAYAVNFVRLGGIITVFAISLFVIKNLKNTKKANA